MNDTERAALMVGFLAIMKGYSDREVGRELGMTVATVKLHMKHLFYRLNVRSRGEALALARKHRWSVTRISG